MLDIDATYEAHAHAIRRYMAAHAPASDIDDLCSAVWVKVCEAAARYEDRGYPVTAWLFTIARTKLIDRARHNARYRWRLAPLVEGSAVVEGPGLPVDFSFLARLSERHRQALLLAAVGYDIRSGARVLGTTPAGYKATLWRAREKAREAL